MTRTIRVAVIECDTPIPPVVAKEGNYGDIFERLLQKGLQSINNPTVTIQVSKWNVVENQVYPKPEDCDGFLLSGSSTLCVPGCCWCF